MRKIRTKKVLKADDLLPKNGDAYSNEDFGSRYSCMLYKREFDGLEENNLTLFILMDYAILIDTICME